MYLTLTNVGELILGMFLALSSDLLSGKLFSESIIMTRRLWLTEST